MVELKNLVWGEIDLTDDQAVNLVAEGIDNSDDGYYISALDKNCKNEFH